MVEPEFAAGKRNPEVLKRRLILGLSLPPMDPLAEVEAKGKARNRRILASITISKRNPNIPYLPSSTLGLHLASQVLQQKLQAIVKEHVSNDAQKGGDGGELPSGAFSWAGATQASVYPVQCGQ